MAVTLTGSNGLFTRLGKGFFALKQAVDHQAVIASEIEDYTDEFDGTSQDMVDGVYQSIESLQVSAVRPMFNILSDSFVKTMVDMVDDDASLKNETLQEALIELIDQMLDNSESIQANTVTTSSSVDGDSVGNGVLFIDVTF